MTSLILFILCSIPTDWHLSDDKNGDGDKAIDILIVGLITALLTGFAALIGMPKPWRVPIWCASWHILIFDYAIVYLLRKNNVITPHAKWWSYVGHSSKVWDRIIGKLHWGVRMTIRVALFVGSLFLL